MLTIEGSRIPLSTFPSLAKGVFSGSAICTEKSLLKQFSHVFFLASTSMLGVLVYSLNVSVSTLSDWPFLVPSAAFCSRVFHEQTLY